MDGSGADPAANPHGWIRHGRARLNVAMRLASRSHAVLSVAGAGRGRRRSAAAAASTIVDLALSRHLAGSDRPATGIHAAIDAADLAVWTALQDRPGPAQLNTAMTGGHPLAIEAGARYGWRGLAVPVGGAIVAEATARARGRRSTPAAFVWQVAAVAGGAGLSGYVDRLRARRLAAHEVVLAADLDRAELQAENEVALGLGNVIDEIQRAAALVRLSAEVPSEERPWKAGLAERTRRSHRYLVDVVVGWQQAHNRTSDLREVVDLVVDPVLAPVVLEAGAAEALERALDLLDLRGRTSFGPAEAGGGASTTSPGVVSGVLAVRVGAHDLVLDTGVDALRLHVDPLPGGFAWLALWLAAAGPQDGVPAAASLGPASVALGLMGWAHRAGRGTAPAPAVPAVVAASVLTVGAGWWQTRSVRLPRDQPDLPRLPMSLTLRGHALVTALVAPRLPRPVLVGAALAGAATVALAWRATPPPAPAREVLAELSWVVMSAAMARAFTEGIERDAAEVERQIRADEDARRSASAAAGRAVALARVQEALDDARALAATHRAALPDDVATEADRRLTAAAAALPQG